MNYLSILATFSDVLLSASTQNVDAFVLRAPSSSLSARQPQLSTIMSTSVISDTKVVRTIRASKAATITKTVLNSNSNANNNEHDEADNSLTQVGSTDYYQGFLNRSIEEEPTERVTGDAILGPTLKFAGGVSLILVALVGVFLVSNGIV